MKPTLKLAAILSLTCVSSMTAATITVAATNDSGTGSLAVNCSINGTLIVQNIGTRIALTSFVRFYLSNDNQFDPGDTFLKQVATGTVKVGKSTRKVLSANLPTNLSASGKFIIAVIDSNNTVAECDETNNFVVFGPLP